MAIASSDRKAALSGKTPHRTGCSETSKNINKHKLNKYDKLNNSDPASSADASHKNGKRDLNFIQTNTCKVSKLLMIWLFLLRIIHHLLC